MHGVYIRAFDAIIWCIYGTRKGDSGALARELHPRSIDEDPDSQKILPGHAVDSRTRAGKPRVAELTTSFDPAMLR